VQLHDIQTQKRSNTEVQAKANLQEFARTRFEAKGVGEVDERVEKRGALLVGWSFDLSQGHDRRLCNSRK
jgi:hypothetical protein